MLLSSRTCRHSAYITDCWLPPLRPPFWMAPQLSQSESQMRGSVRVYLLQALIWCYYSADGETGSVCGSRELLVDIACLRLGLVALKHILNKQSWNWYGGGKTVFSLLVCPPKITTSSDSSTHPRVCVPQAKWLNLSLIFLSYSPFSQMFLIHFS